MAKTYKVNFTWDDEANVWIAISNDIPLALESDSLDTLMSRVRLAAPEIIELNHSYVGNIDFEFYVAHKERLVVGG